MPSQGGVLTGMNPTTVNPGNPLVLLIIQVNMTKGDGIQFIYCTGDMVVKITAILRLLQV